MPNLKFLAQTVPDNWRGSQNSKSRSLDPFPTSFDLILFFTTSFDSHAGNKISFCQITYFYSYFITYIVICYLLKGVKLIESVQRRADSGNLAL